jgi:hypothetical protein
MAGFDEQARLRFVAAVRAGESTVDAAEEAGVAPRTAHYWLSRGKRARQLGQSGPHAAFATEVEAAETRYVDAGLSRVQLVRLLERQALRGSIRAIGLLLDRPWERTGDPVDADRDDRFAELDALPVDGHV